MTSLGDDDVLLPSVGELCEGPTWDARTGRLVWVDILAGRVHSADPVTRDHACVEIGMPVGCLSPRMSGGWVAAVERGFLFLDDRWAPTAPVVPAPGQRDGTRFNDGLCDPRGRFWAGTLSYDEAPGAGCLYRYDGEQVVQVLDDVTISNGIDWSPDGSIMYYVDTAAGTVDVMDFDDDSGTPTARRTLVSVDPAEGAPDGITVDIEGFVWLALWGGGCVRRYSPDGRLDRTLRLPVSRVTSVVFGGADLDHLFVTTAWDGLTGAERAQQPLAGSVFSHRPGVRGRAPSPFLS